MLPVFAMDRSLTWVTNGRTLPIQKGEIQIV